MMYTIGQQIMIKPTLANMDIGDYSAKTLKRIRGYSYYSLYLNGSLKVMAGKVITITNIEYWRGVPIIIIKELNLYGYYCYYYLPTNWVQPLVLIKEL